MRGEKCERLYIVAGKCGDKIVVPMTYSGIADSALYELWFESFCSEIVGNIVVIHNASIHIKNKLFEIAERFKVTLLFQQPYSPNFNKIEKFWAWLKKELRTVMKMFDNLFDTVCCCFQIN
ncbi:MAG: transposase [Clostridia bacterium]